MGREQVRGRVEHVAQTIPQLESPCEQRRSWGLALPLTGLALRLRQEGLEGVLKGCSCLPWPVLLGIYGPELVDGLRGE